jgi:hypothetical protein
MMLGYRVISFSIQADSATVPGLSWERPLKIKGSQSAAIGCTQCYHHRQGWLTWKDG